jgi:hypothetical protein
MTAKLVCKAQNGWDDIALHVAGMAKLHDVLRPSADRNFNAVVAISGGDQDRRYELNGT